MINVSTLFSQNNPKGGQARLDDAFRVFEDAKLKAEDAIKVISEEAQKVDEEISMIEANYLASMSTKKEEKGKLEETMTKANNFLGKVKDILG
jgi:hypothetical protein